VDLSLTLCGSISIHPVDTSFRRSICSLSTLLWICPNCPLPTLLITALISVYLPPLMMGENQEMVGCWIYRVIYCTFPFFYIVCKQGGFIWDTDIARIVSRELQMFFFISIDRSHIAIPYGSGSFAFKISFLCRICQFSRLSVPVDSLLCEWSWAIRLSTASVVAPYYSRIPLRGSCKCCFGGKFLKMNTVPVKGSCRPVL
jgi:hypothetical protein